MSFRAVSFRPGSFRPELLDALLVPEGEQLTLPTIMMIMQIDAVAVRMAAD